MKVFSRGGVGVYDDYRENIIVDPNHPVLRWKAEKDKFSPRLFSPDIAARFSQGLPRISSVHSEDALSWNVFRSLEKAGKLDVLTELLGLPTDLQVTYFWHRREGPEVPQETQTELNDMEPWGKDGWRQQTETDVTLRGVGQFILVESKLGKPGTKVSAWIRSGPPDRLMRREYLRFMESLGRKGNGLFNDSFDFEHDGRRFYQLFRNYLLGAGLASKWNVGFSLVAIVNGRNLNLEGRTHTEEFAAFKAKLVTPANTFLMTWQELCGATVGEPSLAPLHEYLSLHPLLNLL